MNPNSTLRQARAAAINSAMPDRCNITHPSSVPTVVNGVTSFTQIAYTYLGSTDIPCRLDIGRAQRNEMLDKQEAVASEWVLHLPYEFLIDPNDKITLTDSRGKIRRLEVKKAADFEQWGVTAEYIVTEIEFQHG